jgi:hypothetical protein
VTGSVRPSSNTTGSIPNSRSNYARLCTRSGEPPFRNSIHDYAPVGAALGSDDPLERVSLHDSQLSESSFGVNNSRRRGSYASLNGSHSNSWAQAAYDWHLEEANGPEFTVHGQNIPLAALEVDAGTYFVPFDLS